MPKNLFVFFRREKSAIRFNDHTYGGKYAKRIFWLVKKKSAQINYEMKRKQKNIFDYIL